MTHGYIKGNVQQPQFVFGLDTKVTNVEGSGLERQPARDFSWFYFVAQNNQVVYYKGSQLHLDSLQLTFYRLYYHSILPKLGSYKGVVKVER
jgi:hypothetical protein